MHLQRNLAGWTVPVKFPSFDQNEELQYKIIVVPPYANLKHITAFMNVAKNFGDSEYTLVHCSAGVGRTGS
jgi:protein-tyrosine phosphatase